MKERPILFSGEMVRAILDGRKTQTRRIIKPQPVVDQGWEDDGGSDWCLNWEKQPDDGLFPGAGGEAFRLANFCPLGKPGDRLWVRETWARAGKEYGRGSVSPEGVHAVYRADEPLDIFRWRPSIHMPRWASRINLEITKVRVERLQDISEEDAIAEGIEFEPVDQTIAYRDYSKTDTWIADWSGRYGSAAQASFKTLWDLIASPNTNWSANPWVWVIEFKRVA